MKWVKVIGIPLLVSFSISILLAALNYTPTAQREPDTYYFSAGETMFFAMLYLTPILLTFSVLTFTLYTLFPQMTRPPRIVLSGLFAGVMVGVALFFLFPKEETNNIFLIPEGLVGDVLVFYNVKDAPVVQRENGYNVHVINESGYFATSTPDMNYGEVTDRYYYVDKTGNRTPISDACVSLFGTSGYEITEDDETTVSLVYTGFNLTQNECSEAFKLDSRPYDARANQLIEEIEQRYYE